MLRIWDESWVASFEASKAEARSLGVWVRGSEHLLLGVLRVGGETVELLRSAEPRLEAEAIREASQEAVDDLPYLRDLGIDQDLLRDLAEREEHRDPEETRCLSDGGTAELTTALNAANNKYWYLIKHKRLPNPDLVSSDLLLLTVFEPGCRANDLLVALGIDPDWLRELVLWRLALDGYPPDPPEWPGDVPRGWFTRVADRFSEWINVEGTT